MSGRDDVDVTSDAREHNAWKPGDGTPRDKLCNCTHVTSPYATTGTCCGSELAWCCCGAVQKPEGDKG